MPTSPETLALIEAYRQTTVELREQFIREFAALWPGAAALATPGPARQQWLELLVALVERWRPVFHSLALETYRAQAEADTGAVPAFLLAGGAGLALPDLDLDELVAAMVVLVFAPLGREAAREQGEPRRERVTTRETRVFEQAAESTARITVNAGRQAQERAVRQDRLALGWMRITDSDPCAFCLMLASRGPVYKTAQTAGFVLDPVRGEINRYHDNCACQVVPVFTKDPVLPESTQRAEATYEQAQREARQAGELRRDTSNDALNALRRFMASPAV